MRRQMMEWSREHVDLVGRRAGRDGRFEIKGTVEKKGLGLIARMPGWICTDPTPFAPGARDLKIVMTQAGGIEGSLTSFGSQAWSTYSEPPFQVRLTGSKVLAPKRNEGRGHSSSAGLSLRSKTMERSRHASFRPGRMHSRFVRTGRASLSSP